MDKIVGDGAPAAAASRRGRAALVLGRRWRRMSLLWRVFATNAVVFAAAVAILAWTPVTVHRIATPDELVVLGVGLVLVLAINLALLQRTFSPLRHLAATMGEVEPTQPGRRAEPLPSAGKEVLTLSTALNEMLDRLEGERRDSGRRVLAAQEAERTRIAAELHDEVGQTLTAIALRAGRAMTDPAARAEALAEIEATALRSLEDVRRIGRELRPEALDDLGLVNALVALCRRISRQGGLPVRRDLDWHLPPLAPEVELVIYRTAQEGLTNALRHSGASEVLVRLHGQAGSVRLTVSDDGRGMPPRITERGLRGMRERALVIGAQLDVAPNAPRGTEITLTIPVGESL